MCYLSVIESDAFLKLQAPRIFLERAFFVEFGGAKKKDLEIVPRTFNDSRRKIIPGVVSPITANGHEIEVLSISIWKDIDLSFSWSSVWWLTVVSNASLTFFVTFADGPSFV